LAVAIGLGFLVAAYVAYRLVRSWGIVKQQPRKD
jgi:hypothetical protein